MPLEEEVATYRRELPRLLSEGKASQYVLIKGSSIIGIYPTLDEGLETGREMFGLEDIAVKQIDPRDVERFARIDTAGKVTRKEVMALEAEVATYRRELPKLLSEGQAGRWVLLKDASVIGVWPTYGEALEVGYERFGLDVEFAVKLVDPRDVDRFARMDATKETPCLS